MPVVAIKDIPAAEAFDAKLFLSRAGPGRTVADYKKNQVIFCQGEPAEAVFYILKGRVKLTVLSHKGKEAVVGLPDEGQFFGESCLNGCALRGATTVALSDCTITAVPKKTMLSMLREEPAFSELFTSYLLARNSRIEEDLIDQLFNTSEKRLARLLVLLASSGKDGTSRPVAVELSQETLAEMIGTTRSRVSFFMNKFRRLGFVSYNGRIEVHHSLLDAVSNSKSRIRGEPV